MVDVLLQCFAKYDYIVVINEGELPFHVGQGHVHTNVKSAGCVVESE